MGHLRLGYENHWQQKNMIISTLKDGANLQDATLKNGGKYRVFSLLKDTSTFQTGLFPLQQAVHIYYTLLALSLILIFTIEIEFS